MEKIHIKSILLILVLAFFVLGCADSESDTSDEKDPNDQMLPFVSDPGFVMIGAFNSENVIVWSEDGTEWPSLQATNDPNILTMPGPAKSYYGVDCNSSGECVAVGDAGAVMYSTDGTTWTEVSTGIEHTLNGVAFGNNLWVAAGKNTSDESGIIFYSDDSGATWQSSNLSGADALKGIAFGDDMWIAYSHGSRQYWSNDGINWTGKDLTNSISEHLYDTWLWDIAYGNGVWVGVGAGNLIVYSTDPTDDTSWSRGSIAGSSNTNATIKAVDFGSGRFIGVGDGNYSNSAFIFVSENLAVDWTEKSIPVELIETAPNWLEDIAFGNNAWSAVSLKGSYLLSEDDGATWSVVETNGYKPGVISDRP